jgi:hypothetical protein
MTPIKMILSAAALTLLLAACGGGGGGAVAAPDPLAEVPASASQSSAGMAAYIDVLASMPSETREPVAVDNFAPPRPDDAEPEPVNR